MPNKKVMIVDDDKEFLSELNETLLMSGYDMVAVNEPELVLETAERTKPDVIVLDIKMPGKNGFHVAQELKESKVTARIPVIAMSAFFARGHDAPLMDICGIKKYIQKPFRPLDIISHIEKALE